MSTYIRVLLTILRENIVIRPCDGHQPTELFISLISDLVPITLFSRKYYNSVTSLQEEHSHPGRTFSITYQVHVVQTLAGAEHKYKLCNFVLGFVFIAPPYVNLFRGKLGNPFREKTDNPFREKFDENEPRLRQKRPHEAAWVGNSSTVYDGGSRTHTRLGQFPKLDCSTNKRVPTPNDASSESSRRHVSNACLVGTDTIPTMGISSMEKSAQGIPGVIDNVVYGYCSH